LKETAENSQKLPTKHMLKVPKKSGKSNLKLARNNSADSGSDTNSDASSTASHSDLSEGSPYTDTSFGSQSRAGGLRGAGACRFCFGLNSLDGSVCFYCTPSSTSSTDSSSSAVSEDYTQNTPPKQKAPCILNSFATIHEIVSQPGPTLLRVYLSTSKYAASAPAFITATPSIPTSKSQLWRSQGNSPLTTKPVNIVPPEGTLHKSLSANSLLELSFPKSKVSQALISNSFSYPEIHKEPLIGAIPGILFFCKKTKGKGNKIKLKIMGEKL
jgi:hypothetical protein